MRTNQMNKLSTWTRLTQSKYFVYVLISPLFLILLAYVIYPLYKTFMQSVVGENGFTMENYARFFNPESDANMEALFNSVYISIISVITCAVVGVTMAFLLERYDFPGRKILSILVFRSDGVATTYWIIVIYILVRGKRHLSKGIPSTVQVG